jgi:hypothetical protein
MGSSIFNIHLYIFPISFVFLCKSFRGIENFFCKKCANVCVYFYQSLLINCFFFLKICSYQMDEQLHFPFGKTGQKKEGINFLIK